MFRGFNDEIFSACVLVPRVMSEPHRIALAGAGPGGGVVEAAAIIANVKHGSSGVGHEPRADAYIGGALRPQRVLPAVALLGSVGVVEKRIDGLLAAGVDDAQRVTPAYDRGPWRARGHLGIENHAA